MGTLAALLRHEPHWKIETASGLAGMALAIVLGAGTPHLWLAMSCSALAVLAGAVLARGVWRGWPEDENPDDSW